MSLKIIDIGANLTDPVFTGIYRGKQAHPDDFQDILNRASEVGVVKMMITGGSLKESRKALELCKQHESLYCTAGVHPTRCNEFEQNKNGPEAHLESLLGLLEEGKGKIVAVGEFGLDYDRTNFCDIEVQKKYFELQFRLAEAAKLPLFLHMRAASVDFIDIVRRNRHRFDTGVVHSFTGTLQEMQQLLDMGFYIGINGCSLKTKENLEVVSAVPTSRLMVETDCPYCDIRPTHAGFEYVKTKWETKKKERFEAGKCVKSRNEPALIIQVLEVLAAIKSTTVQALSDEVYANTMRVFFGDSQGVP